jgi:hypothetical protein
MFCGTYLGKYSRKSIRLQIDLGARILLARCGVNHVAAAPQVPAIDQRYL